MTSVFLLAVLVTHSLADNPFDLLCRKVFFSAPPLDKFPYKSTLESVYVKTNIIMYNFPVYKQERGKGYFRLDANYFHFVTNISLTQEQNISIPVDIGMTYNPSIWSKFINNKTNPFGGALFTNLLAYYDNSRWRTKFTVKPVCVQFTQCQSNKLIFEKSDKKNASSNHTEYYFKAIPNLFTFNRPVYLYYNGGKNTNKIYLFYRNNYWIIGEKYWKDEGFYSVKSDVLKPEYIYQTWRKTTGKVWVNVDEKLQCWSDTPNCTSISCKNNGYCVTNLLNEAYCMCTIGYTGKHCETKAVTCPEQPNPNFNNDIGSVAVRFCRNRFNRPYHQIGLCKSNRKWSGFTSTCFLNPSVPPTTAAYTPRRTNTKPTNAKTDSPINVDKLLPHFKIYFSVVGTLLILFGPLLHRMVCSCGLSAWTLYSGYYYIAMILWVIFLILYGLLGLEQYGNIFTFLFFYGIGCAIIMYLYVLIEAMVFSSEAKYLSEATAEGENIRNIVHKIVITRPSLCLVGECYHFETRTRIVYYTDANGNSQSRTETYQEKVVTWTGQEIFDFKTWCDVTDLKQLTSIENSSKTVRVKFIKTYKCADEETETTKQTFKENFDEKNGHKDTYFLSHFKYDIDGYKERILIYGRNGQDKPACLNCGCFCLFTCCLLAWPYRFFLKWSTDKQEVILEKRISVKNELSHSSSNGAFVSNNVNDVSNASAPQQPTEVLYPQNQPHLSENFMIDETGKLQTQKPPVLFQPTGVYYNHDVGVTDSRLSVSELPVNPPSYAESCSNYN